MDWKTSVGLALNFLELWLLGISPNSPRPDAEADPELSKSGCIMSLEPGSLLVSVKCQDVWGSEHPAAGSRLKPVQQKVLRGPPEGAEDKASEAMRAGGQIQELYTHTSCCCKATCSVLSLQASLQCETIGIAHLLADSLSICPNPRKAGPLSVVGGCLHHRGPEQQPAYKNCSIYTNENQKKGRMEGIESRRRKNPGV